eukprot:44423_1
MDKREHILQYLSYCCIGIEIVILLFVIYVAVATAFYHINTFELIISNESEPSKAWISFTEPNNTDLNMTLVKKYILQHDLQSNLQRKHVIVSQISSVNMNQTLRQQQIKFEKQQDRKNRQQNRKNTHQNEKTSDGTRNNVHLLNIVPMLCYLYYI